MALRNVVAYETGVAGWEETIGSIVSSIATVGTEIYKGESAKDLLNKQMTMQADTNKAQTAQAQAAAAAAQSQAQAMQAMAMAQQNKGGVSTGLIVAGIGAVVVLGGGALLLSRRGGRGVGGLAGAPRRRRRGCRC